MLTLRTSPASPFGRKVRIAAALLGLEARIADRRRRHQRSRQFAAPAESARQDPDADRRGRRSDLRQPRHPRVSRRPRRRRAIDSDRFHGADARALTLQALADGIADAALLQVYEQRMRQPTERSAKWVDYQAGKVTRALAALEAKPPQMRRDPRRRDRARLRARLSRSALRRRMAGRIIRGWSAGSTPSPPPLPGLTRATAFCAAPRYVAAGANTKKGPAGFPAGPLPLRAFEPIRTCSSGRRGRATD